MKLKPGIWRLRSRYSKLSVICGNYRQIICFYESMLEVAERIKGTQL